MFPNNDASVEFTHNITSGGSFSLDNNESDATFASEVTFTPDAAAQYAIVVPTPPLNYHIDAIQCDTIDVTVQLDQNRVLIDVDDVDIVCTFVLVGNICFSITFISDQESNDYCVV